MPPTRKTKPHAFFLVGKKKKRVNKTMDTNSDTVISMHDWKKENLNLQEEESYKNYLRVLKFHDLIALSNDHVRDLKKGSLNQTQIMESRLLLKEFKRRLGSTAPSFEPSLTSKNAEKSIIELSDYL